MERQRSSSPNHLLSPKSLLLLSFASSSLLFSFLFSLFALRFGRPFHLPFAASIGANGSAIARAPVLGGRGAGVEVEVEAFLGGGNGGLGANSALEGDRRGRAGDFPVSSAEMEMKEAVIGGGNVGPPANGAVLEGSEIKEAGNYSLRGLDSTMEVKKVDPGDGGGEKRAKDSVLEKLNSVVGGNFSKEVFGPTRETRLNLSNDSASQGAAVSLEKLKGAKSAQAVNVSMEASGPAMGTKGEFLHGGHVRGSFNSVREAYASQQGKQWKSSDHSTVKNNSGAAPISPNKQDIDLIQEAVVNKMDLTRSNAVQCDVYDGSWVLVESYPLYMSNSCPFIDEGFSCEANGRMDQSYKKWRWQPTHCNIPRFDARKMLEMLRGKRLVFVGDSINRNQWESMMCLLREAVSDPARIHEAHGRRITKERGDYNFKFLDYNCSVEYHVTHFLVHEGKARIGQKRKQTLRIDTIDRSSSRWRGANVLVFNTAHWWSHHKTKAGVNYYQEGDAVHPHLDASTAFRRALTTWASWVDRYINPRKTHVFFRSSAPSHFSGGEWNLGGHCRKSTMPLNDTRARPVPEKNVILGQVVKQMKTPVTILNITNLSGIRIDGHPSVYGRKAGDLTTSSIQDCSHWCLPGVPDTWNELLFYHLVSSRENDVTD